MRGAIGLLLYVAMIILSNILKKAAEQKSKQAEVLVEDESETYTITLEDMLEEKEAVTVAPSSEVILDVEQIVENLPSWEEPQEQVESPGDVAKTRAPALKPEQFDWEQAIVLAEIIREPRAKRPWPSR